MPTSEYAERLLRFVRAKGYSPQGIEEIATTLEIPKDDRRDFQAVCNALQESGRVVLGQRGTVSLPPPPPRLEGEFRAHLRGFGFVIPDEPNSQGDLYVPAGATGGAMSGDRVVVSVKKKGKRRSEMRYEARVLKVLQRGQNRFVGELQKDKSGKVFVLPDGKVFHSPIFVADAGSKNARIGDKVVVEVTRFPSEHRSARGVVIKVLGKRGEPGVDTLGIIEQYGLPTSFPPEVQSESADVIRKFDAQGELETREDLRKETIITIDPRDARDFDDAISLKVLSQGRIELGVHIADVAHFVREGGTIDEEARRRTTSAYLCRTVIPMLPETLSNGVCSLQERETRLTKSVFITYDRTGQVKETRLANTVIKSSKRLTYEQASAILDGRPGRTSAKIVALISQMEGLARRILARRMRDGMLRLDLPEAQLVFDKDGRPTDVVPADTSFSHTIIEMFMVEANEAVARKLTELNVPHMRRIHDAPPELADGTLQAFLFALGYKLESTADRFALQALLDSASGNPEAQTLHFAVLRSMRQAAYSPLRLGHFALASEQYCHFTSPIRRYPDLTIHRLVDLCVKRELGNRRDGTRVPTTDALAELSDRCSTNERRIESAERELRTILTLGLLVEHLGEEFQGTVTGVAGMGVFVQLDKYLIDGLIRFETLPDDWWEVDDSGAMIVGERSGVRIKIGDRVVVVIAKVDVRSRQLDLVFAKESRPTAPTPQRVKKRRGRTSDSRPKARRGRRKKR